MTIFKLCPNETLLSVIYQRVCGYIVVFSQSLSLLSTIFLSLVIKLYEHIWIVWFTTSKPDTF